MIFTPPPVTNCHTFSDPQSPAPPLERDITPVFNIGLVFMVLLLIGFHLILPHVLRQSPSKIPLHLSQIFLVVYLKVPSLAHFFSLFIQLLLALSSPRTQSNTTSMLMTPNCTFLSLLQIQLLHLKYSLILSLTYSPG